MNLLFSAILLLLYRFTALGYAVSFAPLRCYHCQGIDLPDCLSGGRAVKICPKGVQSCYMAYRRSGSVDQVDRGCRDAGVLANIKTESVCTKSSMFGLWTVICSCATDLCNGNSTLDLRGVPDRFFVEWR